MWYNLLTVITMFCQTTSKRITQHEPALQQGNKEMGPVCQHV